MVVHLLRLSSRRALNCRKLSTSAKFKQYRVLKWAPLVIGGACVGCGATEFLYPKSITGYIPFITNKTEDRSDQQDLKTPLITATKDVLSKVKSKNSSEETTPELEISDKSFSDITDNLNNNPVQAKQPSISSQTIEPLHDVAIDDKVQCSKSDSVVENYVAEDIDCPVLESDLTISEGDSIFDDQTSSTKSEIINTEPLIPEMYDFPTIASEEEPLPVEPSAFLSNSYEAESLSNELSALVDEVPVTEIICVTVKSDPEESVTEAIPISSVAEEVCSDIQVDVMEATIDNALNSAPLMEEHPEELDEAQIIMDALSSLDYEPVLSDSILELLVGKAASREKAVVATISRLENAMASVVNEVQAAMEHHNKTSSLVAVAREHAQSISEATNKETARGMLDQLIESSSAVRCAFEEGEIINARASGAFSKLSEIIEKAEQFNLKGPVSAARTLLTKSRNDYYSSCETAQENQVDHALVSHYQQSVVNRKKVLDRELEILRDHFPKQHIQLNQTFESAGYHRAQVDELNTLIMYLSSKVSRLETELEEQQTAELKKLKMVAEAQKAEDIKILEERLKGQAEQLRYQHEIEQQTEVEAAVAAARDESARHAAKQAHILKQEMTEATDRQIRDITSFWSDEASLRESVVEVEYQCKLEKTNSLISSVSETLDIQSERYQDLLQNLRLLNLTTALFDTINSGETVDEDRVRAGVSLLKSEFGKDELVGAVAATIPEAVRVATFSQLNDRLRGLSDKCRRAALITSEECGIGSRLLSRVMSFITLNDTSYDTPPEEGGSQTLYYIAKANKEMKNNNLDLAARYLNQLAGEPRSLVQEWIVDARTLLEMRQSANVLLNYAKSRNGGP